MKSKSWNSIQAERGSRKIDHPYPPNQMTDKSAAKAEAGDPQIAHDLEHMAAHVEKHALANKPWAKKLAAGLRALKRLVPPDPAVAPSQISPNP